MRQDLYGIRYSDGVIFEIGLTTRLHAELEVEKANDYFAQGESEFGGATLVVRPVEVDWLAVTD